MSNLASMLKDEIRRLAKREVRAETNRTKRTIAQYRRDITELKRLVAEQGKRIAAIQAQAGASAAVPAEEPGENFRFSARSVKAQRKRLRLSASDYGKLVGVSPLTIYAWEQGKSRPRKAQLAALVAVRGIGKRGATKKLSGQAG
jgi:DNA-binding transcriptional regulator YiaG